MKHYSQKNNTQSKKRLPFIDRTNLMCREDAGQSNTSGSVVSKDPKFKLNLTVHLQCLHLNSAVFQQACDPKFKLNSKVHLHCMNSSSAPFQQASDPKFKLTPKVHLQCIDLNSERFQRTGDSKFKLNSRVHLQRIKLIAARSHDFKRAAAHDPKFRLILKVHLERLDITNIMPNLQSTQAIYDNNVVKRKGDKNIARDISESDYHKSALNTSVQGDADVTVLKQPNKLKTVIARESSATGTINGKKININPKFYQKCAVHVDHCRELEEVLRFSMKQNAKIVRFVEDPNSTDKFTKILRKRRTKNYTESSLNDSQEIEKTKEATYKEHVPIYLQDIGNAQNTARKDPFEFISSSPKKKRGRPVKEPKSPLSHVKKRGRGRPPKVEDCSSDSDSAGYDKSMHDLLKVVRKKVTKKCKYVKRAKNKVVASRNNGKMQKNVEGSALVPNIAVTAVNVKNTNTLNLLTKEIQFVTRRISDATRRRNNADVRTRPYNDIFFGFEDDQEELEISKVMPAVPVQGTNRRVSRIMQTVSAGKFSSLTSTPLPNAQKYTRRVPERDSKQIHIISNVMVSPPKSRIANQTSRECPPGSNVSALPIINATEATSQDDFFGFDNADQVSVRDSQIRQQPASKPWRGDCLNVTRNPHFLAIKDTSLPCYNQEMILEPKLLERPEAAKTPARTEESRSRNNMVQSSILSFVNTNKRTQVKQVHNSTLFDYDEFSPIKDKDKQSENEVTVAARKSDKGKRNILGAIDNVVASKQHTGDVLDVENYFGFDDEDEEHKGDKENVRVRRNRAKRMYNKNDDARPMRVRMKQLKQVREKIAEELLNKANGEDNRSLSDDTRNDASPDTQPQEVAHVGIFEDLEVQPAYRSYEPKRRKRVRFPSVESIEEEQRPKRKRKDVRSQVEEEEFNNWVASFNAMCDEVDKHSLETD